jgi:hypothetical protein
MDSIRRRLTLAGLTAATLVAPLGFTDPRALAAPSRSGVVGTCFNFGQLPPGFHYHIGDVIQTQIGTVELKNYLRYGNKSNDPSATAYTQNSANAGGAGTPELRTYLINAHFEPSMPTTDIEFAFGHFGAVNGKHANLGVNGDLVEVTTSLADLNNVVLGRQALGGQVQVTVTITAGANTNHEKGTIHLQALNGGTITQASTGGVELFLDDYCTS